jgi:hypothetical protein
MSIERRDYFRVDTSLLMGWRPVSMDPTEEDPLLEINQQIGKAITDSAAEQPTLSQFMSLLNNKIDAVRDELSVSENRRRKRRVNISGSGIAFTTTRPADRGSEIEVSLVLPTTNTPVSVIADVVGCKRIPREREDEPEQYRLRARYQDGQDALTEQIVHFVSKIQQQILAERRHLTHPDLL